MIIMEIDYGSRPFMLRLSSSALTPPTRWRYGKHFRHARI